MKKLVFSMSTTSTTHWRIGKLPYITFSTKWFIIVVTMSTIHWHTSHNCDVLSHCKYFQKTSIVHTSNNYDCWNCNGMPVFLKKKKIKNTIFIIRLVGFIIHKLMTRPSLNTISNMFSKKFPLSRTSAKNNNMHK